MSAFGGATLEIDEDEVGRIDLLRTLPELHRPLSARELPVRQLGFLVLAASPLSQAPSVMIVLHEPEASLHSHRLPAFAELVAVAAAFGQIVVTTHSSSLADALLVVASVLATESRRTAISTLSAHGASVRRSRAAVLARCTAGAQLEQTAAVGRERTMSSSPKRR